MQLTVFSHLVIKSAIKGADHCKWVTKDEYKPNPNSYSMNMSVEGIKNVELSPPHRTRSAFRYQAKEIAEDLTALLRREFR